MNLTKVCGQCQQDKPIDQFSKSSRNKSGYVHNCKSCASVKYFASKEKRAKHRQQYHQAHAEHKRTYDQKYRAKRKDYYRRLKRQWQQAHKNDPVNRIKRNMRRRLLHVLNGSLKASKTFVLVGCTAEQLKVHLENQFTAGMSWDNYGFYGWHIDHVKPCASFDLTNPKEQAKCFHYSNLQPLWQKDNLAKSYKV